MTQSELSGIMLSSASIVLIDLVLAGDNAVVIAMAARRLQPHQRQRVILFGALLAVALRIGATLGVVWLLRVPWLSAIGGVLVWWIALKLLLTEDQSLPSQGAIGGFWQAVGLIAVADFVMSTDNILAVGGASAGRIELIFFGLILSIPLVICSSSWTARMLDRYPILTGLGAAVLGWTAGQMILHDLIQDGTRSSGLIAGDWFGPWLRPFEWAIASALSVGVVVVARALVWRRHRGQPRGVPAGTAESLPPTLERDQGIGVTR